MSPGRILLLLFLTTAIHQHGSGVLLALIPLRIAVEGMPAAVAGVVSAAFSVGFMAGCVAAPTLIARLGVQRAMVAFTLVNAGAAGLLWLFPTPAVWCAGRFIGGCSVGAFFVIVEAWLGAASTTANRGTVFGFYMVLNRTCFMLAQSIFVWLDPRADAIFAAVMALYAVSTVPASFITGQRPEIARKPLSGLLDLPRRAPAAAVGSLGHGLLTATAPALFPAYGVVSGLSTAAIAMALVAIQLGGLVLQMPVAYVSDRMGRRRVMAWVTAGTALLAVVLWLLPAREIGVAAFLLVVAAWAGLPNAIYSTSAAHANDRATPAERIIWASSLLVLWGLGATFGPLLASIAMDLLGAGALFGYSAAVAAGLSAFFVWRRHVRPAERD